MHSATFALQIFDCFSIRSLSYAHYLLHHTHQNIAQSFVSVDAHLCKSPNGRHSIQPIHGNALVHHQSAHGLSPKTGPETPVWDLSNQAKSRTTTFQLYGPEVHHPLRTHDPESWRKRRCQCAQNQHKRRQNGIWKCSEIDVVGSNAVNQSDMTSACMAFEKCVAVG